MRVLVVFLCLSPSHPCTLRPSPLQYRAYERSLALLPKGGAGDDAAAGGAGFDAAAAGAGTSSALALSYGREDHVDPAGLERLTSALAKQDEKRASFHRKRSGGADAAAGGYISRENRLFNARLEKDMGRYSADVKQALERGTAL